MADRLFLLCFALFIIRSCLASYGNDYHPRHVSLDRTNIDPAEKEQSFWHKKAQEVIKQHRTMFKEGLAKNVIFFLGDGMSIPTLTASRIYLGQLNGKNGEESQLAFEKFPVTGLSKTYCVDKQVADSACSATAYLGGVKGNIATIGVNAKVEQENCTQMLDKANHVYSIAKKFIDNGRSAGLVTTTRVTHASPAGVYAHTAFRDWESDADVRSGKVDPLKCRDIAHQLVYNEVGKNLKVILGGGRRMFLNRTVIDEEGDSGSRMDGRNLIEEWKANKTKAAYVWNRDQLMKINDEQYLLGLFESDHCQYHLNSSVKTEPTLADMTEVAIRILQKNKKGFFLFVEGGRIDHAHHVNLAKFALDETVEFSKAVDKAVSMTSRKDTLIVVTSDHAHTMTLNGYPDRGNPILGHVGAFADDDRPLMTLSYANGPGYRAEDDFGRIDVKMEADYGKDDFVSPALVPLTLETHGGDDVGVFALGPWQHMFTGSYEQSTIPHLVAFAACLDDNHTVCSSASTTSLTAALLISAVLCIFNNL